MADYTERFSNKAEIYNTYRPKYPQELRELLVEKLNLTPEKLVADIGSGTGISSEIFLDNGNMVFAVEPNKDMREMAELNFDLEENFVSVAATAENTGLHDESIYLIFAGTAFHWFDFEGAKKEFARILKPDGHIVISWISRDMEDLLQQETEAIYNKYTEEIAATEKQKDDYKVEEFFAPKKPQQASFYHSQTFDLEQFMGRLQSSSYYPNEGGDFYDEMTEDMKNVFEKYQKDGVVEFKYITKIYWV